MKKLNSVESHVEAIETITCVFNYGRLPNNHLQNEDVLTIFLLFFTVISFRYKDEYIIIRIRGNAIIREKIS